MTLVPKALHKLISLPWRSDLLRQSTVYFIGDLLVRAGSLLLVPIYTRTLTREDYGAVAIATLVATLVSYLASLSTSAAILKLSPEFGASHSPGYVVNNIVKFVIGWSLVLGGLLSLLVPSVTLQVFRSSNLVSCNQLAVITGCFSGITSVLLSVFQGNQKPLRYRVVTVCSFSANLVTGLVAVLLLHLGGFGAVMGQLVGAACGCGVALLSADVKLSASFDPGIVRRALGIGIPLTVYSLGGFSTDQLSRVFIERYVSAGALGVYNIAFLYCTAVAFVFGAINTAWVPRFFQMPRDNSAGLSGHYGTAVILAAIAMGGIMTLLAPLVIDVLVGRDYQGAVAFVPLLMINAILSGPIWSLLMNPLVLAGRNWCIAGCAVASGGCNLLLNLWLTLHYGVWGAALSSMLSLVLLTALVAHFSSRAYPVVYEYKSIFQVGVVVVVICAFVDTLDLAGTIGHLLRLVMAALCAGLACAVLYHQWTRQGGHPAHTYPAHRSR